MLTPEQQENALIDRVHENLSIDKPHVTREFVAEQVRSRNRRKWAGGIFGLRIDVGFDVQIEVYPEALWTSAKLFFFDGLAAIVGADLTKNEQAIALAQLIEGINNDPDHDEGGWLEVHTRKSR